MRVDSNVPEAVVRVDGVELGRVADAPTFSERFGVGASYDVELRAPGYRMARRQVRPNVVDPGTGIPAILGAGFGCVGGCCAMPVAAVLAGPGTFAATAAWLAAAGLVAGSGGACAAALGASTRLPDVITVPLEPERDAAHEDDLPPPPTDDAAPAATATSAAGGTASGGLGAGAPGSGGARW